MCDSVLIQDIPATCCHERMHDADETCWCGPVVDGRYLRHRTQEAVVREAVESGRYASKGAARRAMGLGDTPYGRLPKRSLMERVRARVARWLVKLASRIDRRPHVSYQISHHAPQGWRTGQLSIEMPVTAAGIDSGQRRWLNRVAQGLAGSYPR